jgi:hypothetical protein
MRDPSSDATMAVGKTHSTTMHAPGHLTISPYAPVGALGTSRSQWIDAFSTTLLSLKPRQGEAAVRQLADELWAELHHFDPVMAAELEFESSLCDA